MKREVLIDLTTFREYRLLAHLPVSLLAALAGVNRRTAKRADSGKPVRDVQAAKLLEVLSERLDRKIEPKDVEDLNIV